MDSATHTGVQEGEQTEAEFNKTPVKTVYELPDEHPMKKRALAMDAADDLRMADFQKESGREPKEETKDDKTDVSTAADDTAAETKPAENKTDLDAQIAAQGEELILTPEMLAKAKVKVTVDGVEELQPADKVLRQYQKGAAADVRLAEASRLVKENQAAREEIERARKEAQERTTMATTSAEKQDAQARVQSAQAATEKFEAASEALYAGNSKEAAALFSEAVALAQSPVAPASTAPVVNAEEMAGQIANRVEQNLSQKSALRQLFKDYPEIEGDKAYAFATDHAINALIANGKSMPDAILEAGELVGEKYKLGKFAPKPAGRQVKSNGPTTQAEKLEAKKDLDNLQVDDARASSGVEREPSASDIIAEIAKSRPGMRQV